MIAFGHSAALYHSTLSTSQEDELAQERSLTAEMLSMLQMLWEKEESKKRFKCFGMIDAIRDRIIHRVMGERTEIQNKLVKWGYVSEYIPYSVQTENFCNVQANTGHLQYQNNISELNHNYNMYGHDQLPGGHPVARLPVVDITLLGGSIQAPVAGVYAPHGTEKHYHNTIHYKLLRCMEEMAPKELPLAQYDDDASFINEQRRLGPHIPICWVVSFAVSNRCEPEMATLILENDGYSVVKDDLDG